MRQITAIFHRNLLNFSRDRMRLVFTFIMSLFLLFVFSFVMKSSIAMIKNPMSYLISGIVIMTVFQTALNSSTFILEDISGGFMKEIIVSPIYRWQISIGQILSSSVIAIVQGILVLVAGIFLGLRMDPMTFIEVIGVMAVVGVTFSSMGLFLAAVAKSSSTFQIMATVLVMPLTFLSGAYIPTTIMPKFLEPIVYINPLTYVTSIFRFVTMKMWNVSTSELVKEGVAFNVGRVTITPQLGFLFIILFGLLFFALSVNEFNKADFSSVRTGGMFHHH